MKSRHFTDKSHINVETRPLPDGIVFDRNLKVAMRDGTKLAVNMFRPAQPGRYPVIMAVSPYGKDEFNQYPFADGLPVAHIGDIALSDHVAFEAPDPAYWVPRGYIVIQADTRGQGQSEGLTGPYHIQDRQDYYDLIEWAGTQPWSNGNVGLNGVSYLCTSQWMVAPLRPPHLRAIVAWEGWNDFFRRFYFGGIPETRFMSGLWDNWICPLQNQQAPGLLEPDFIENAGLQRNDSDYWRQFDCDLKNIDVPALICASFSDQGCHTRDTFEGFKQISSRDKWLFSHRRPKWSAYYEAEALDWQTRFLDYYLKSAGEGLLAEPRVRIEINSDRDSFKVVRADNWPIPEARAEQYFLRQGNKLDEAPSAQTGTVSYRPDGTECAHFDYIFSRPTDIVGTSKLKLWVSTDAGDDIDLFVGLRKLDRNGEEVFFQGFAANPNDVVARGWLRVSSRELDESRSTPLQPWLTHRCHQPVRPGEIVPVEIEILPTGTSFEAGDTLRLVIQGAALQPDAVMYAFEEKINQGVHSIHFGGDYDSHLLLPTMNS